VIEAQWERDDESDLEQDNVIEDLETTAQQDVSAAQNVPGLIQPTRKSKRQAEMLIMMVSTMKTRKNKGIKNK
jgi:hypothetical protein